MNEGQVNRGPEPFRMPEGCLTPVVDADSDSLRYAGIDPETIRRAEAEALRRRRAQIAAYI